MRHKTLDLLSQCHKCLGSYVKGGLAAKSPTRSLIFKVVIARLLPPFCGNSFGVPPDHIVGIDVPATVPTAIVPSTRISISFMVGPQAPPRGGKVGEKCSGHVVYAES